ncbi:helix-turn-helix transcriptional regulator [Phenylobacterium sp.]|uniref:helix-turn-helix domain-containing protein n=1 Tax=Phenylobacterium sp. TaxID=1871053 RepID=UPI00286D442C|nr:helix-turn-helix transcriptional regulator [Phenylobacterium sp.]
MSNRGERLQQAIRWRNHQKMLGLAHDLDVDESAISRWKRGGPMSLDHASRLCLVLDVSMDWLILGRGEIEGHKDAEASDAERRLIAGLRSLPPAATDLLTSLVAVAQGVDVASAGPT